MLKTEISQFGFMVLIFVLAVSAQCQQQYHLVQISPDDDGSEQIKGILDEENDAVVARLNSWVNNIDQVCGLSDEQRLKFRVVVKGASAERNEARKKDLKKQAERFVNMNQTTSFAIMSKSPRDIDKVKLWNSSLGKILNDDQNQKFQDWLSERKAFQRNSLVNSLVAEFDQVLFLSAEQRESMVEILDKNFGDTLIRIAERGVPPRRGGRITPTPDPKYLELVEGILNEDQLDQWKRSVEKRLQELR